jgi:hypothetical protein
LFLNEGKVYGHYLAANHPKRKFAALYEHDDYGLSPESLAKISLNASRRLEPMSTVQAAAFLKREQEKFSAIIRSLKLEQQ